MAKARIQLLCALTIKPRSYHSLDNLLIILRRLHHCLRFINKPRNQKALCDLRAFSRSEKEKGFHKTFAAKNLIHGADYYTD